MPEIFKPSPNRVGRPALGNRGFNANRRRRRKFLTVEATPSAMDDLEFSIETSIAPQSSIASTLKTSHKKRARRPTQSRLISPLAKSGSQKLPSITSQSDILQSLEHQPSFPKASSLTHVRRALLVDTRTLDTELCRNVVNSFLLHTREFLSLLRRRGMNPDLLVCLEAPTNNSDRTRPPLIPKASRLLRCSGVSMDGMCEPVFIKPTLTVRKQKQLKKPTKVPTRLLANASWTLFGDLVEEAIRHDQTLPSSERSAPLSVTLLTNNLSLLCDQNIDGAHKAAFTSFWNRVRPFFQKNLVQSIEMEIVEIATVTNSAFESLKEAKEREIIMSKGSGDSAVDMDTPQGMAHNGEGCAMTNGSDEQEPMSPKEFDQVDRFVQKMQQYGQELSEADSKAKIMREEIINGVSFSVSFMSNTNFDFGILARRWLSQNMTPSNLKRSIVFDLPETKDGTQCSIALDVTYRSMPYPVDSQAAAGLLADLHCMSSSSMETVQLVPISCVDANLLIGVPMKVTPAFQNDVGKFKEMNSLVKVLFRQLQERDEALVLHAKGHQESKVSPFGPPLHLAIDQSFLLMPLDAGFARSCPPLAEASLFRCANSYQMLAQGSADLHYKSDDELLKVFATYVEAALELLPNSIMNPLVNDIVRDRHVIENAESGNVSRNEISEKATIESNESWADESGVVSHMRPTEENPPLTLNNKAVVLGKTEGVSTTWQVDVPSKGEKEGVTKILVDDAAVFVEKMEEGWTTGEFDVAGMGEDTRGEDENNNFPCSSREPEHLIRVTSSRIRARVQTKRRTKETQANAGKPKLALSHSSRFSKKQLKSKPIAPLPESSDESREPLPTNTVARLLQRRVFSFPVKSRATIKTTSPGPHDLTSQSSIDDIGEFAATPTERRNIDESLALSHLQFEGDSVDDTRTEQIDGELCKGHLKDSEGLGESESETDDCISDHRNHVVKAKRLSFQKAAATFLDTLTDTDSDPEFD